MGDAKGDICGYKYSISDEYRDLSNEHQDLTINLLLWIPMDPAVSLWKWGLWFFWGAQYRTFKTDSGSTGPPREWIPRGDLLASAKTVTSQEVFRMDLGIFAFLEIRREIMSQTNGKCAYGKYLKVYTKAPKMMTHQPWYIYTPHPHVFTLLQIAPGLLDSDWRWICPESGFVSKGSTMVESRSAASFPSKQHQHLRTRPDRFSSLQWAPPALLQVHLGIPFVLTHTHMVG